MVTSLLSLPPPFSADLSLPVLPSEVGPGVPGLGP